MFPFAIQGLDHVIQDPGLMFLLAAKIGLPGIRIAVAWNPGGTQRNGDPRCRVERSKLAYLASYQVAAVLASTLRSTRRGFTPLKGFSICFTTSALAWAAVSRGPSRITSSCTCTQRRALKMEASPPEKVETPESQSHSFCVFRVMRLEMFYFSRGFGDNETCRVSRSG